MSSPGLRSLPLLSENTNRGHPTASTEETSPGNSLKTFFVGKDSCAYLTRFETVVLVDDSSSMSGPQWQQASDLLADMTKIVAKFHPNGLDIHFFNQAKCNLENATTPELIRRLFTIVKPAGTSSPIATLLDGELSKYMSRYRSNSKLRGLHLLVLTNSVPEDEDQVTEVIFKASKEMGYLKAGKEKISIRFIHNVPNVAQYTFLERLYDAYAKGLIYDHIVVKRIPWDSVRRHALLQEVLSGGIGQQWNDQAHEDAYAARLSNEISPKIPHSSKLPERIMYHLEKPSIRQVLSVALMNCSTQISGEAEQYNTTFDLRWELLAFVRDHLGEGEKLSQVITLTGSQVNAQASTCEQFIREFWPDLGLRLLSFIEVVCDQYLREGEIWMAKWFTGEEFPSVGIEIKIKSDKTTLEVHGPLESQIRVTKILTWLTAAVRSSTPPSLSSSKTRLTFEEYGSDPEKAYFKLQPKPLNPIRNGSQMCWHPLFERSVIVVHYPYAQRTQGIGVELSPFLMATLAGIRTAVEFRGGLILRGLSTALIPLRMGEGEDAIQWHLATTNTRDGAIITEPLDENEGIDGYYKVQDVQQLWAKKAYLGWCSVATVRLGTKEARYRDVTWSDPSKDRRHIEFSGFSLSLGPSALGFGGPTGTANFVIPRVQRTHFMDVENQLKDRLQYSIARSVIVYDTSDQRGWMIPVVCLILYMVHLRARKLPRPPEASQDGPALIPYSRVAKEAAHEAYRILTEYMEPHSASTLGNSEKWNDTLALFYIALDTFFGKSKELRRTSSASHSSDISGFELMDAVCVENPFRYNSRQIRRNSGGWAQLGDTVGILFCRGIGNAIVPGAGANKLCRPWSRVPAGFDYLGAYVPCVVEVLSRQGKHNGSERLRERIVYATCYHVGNARCSHLQTYSQIADPPDDKKKSSPAVTQDEALPLPDNLSSARGAIIFGKRTTLVKPRPRPGKSDVLKSLGHRSLELILRLAYE